MARTGTFRDAAAFAAVAHQHQIRHDGKTPYFTHVARVAMIVSHLFNVQDETIITAALLHDTIEDTEVDYDDLHERFGKKVADIVAALTKDMRLIEPKREAVYDRQLAAGPWEARLIKLADVYDNYLDAATPQARKKVAGRVRRALKLASGDKRLGKASGMVAQLIQSSPPKSRKKKTPRRV